LKTAKIANFTTPSLPGTCYECSWGARRDAKALAKVEHD
jgi:hypothetical protein